MPLRSKLYRDKAKLLRTRNAQRKRYYLKSQIYAPREWLPEEIELLFDFAGNDHELSDGLSRSVQAIQQMRSRVRLKTLANKEETNNV